MKNNYTCIQTGCSFDGNLANLPATLWIDGASCNPGEQLAQLTSYLWLSILLRFPKCFKRCCNIVRIDLWFSIFKRTTTSFSIAWQQLYQFFNVSKEPPFVLAWEWFWQNVWDEIFEQCACMNFCAQALEPWN